MTVTSVMSRSMIEKQPGGRHDLAPAREMARAWAQTIDDAARADEAARFVHAALSAFADVVAPGLAIRELETIEPGDLDAAAAELARSIGETAARLSPIEGCHILTSLYASLLSRRERGAFGVFYTPPSVERMVADRATSAMARRDGWRVARALISRKPSSRYLRRDFSTSRA